MKRNLILFLFLSFICSCYDVIVNYDLKIKNNSKLKISVLYSKVKSGKITENNIAYFIADRNIVYPDSLYDITTLGGQNAWHEVIDSSPDKKLFIYVFSTDSLIRYNSTQYSINDLVYLNKYLKRYEYTETELIKNDWKINFN